jgi:hypothetical protein
MSSDFQTEKYLICFCNFSKMLDPKPLNIITQKETIDDFIYEC